MVIVAVVVLWWRRGDNVVTMVALWHCGVTTAGRTLVTVVILVSVVVLWKYYGHCGGTACSTVATLWWFCAHCGGTVVVLWWHRGRCGNEM